MDALIGPRKSEEPSGPPRPPVDDPVVQRGPPRWLRKHVQMLALLDALAAAVATIASKALAFGLGSTAELHVRSVHIPYAALMVVSVPMWLAVLATSRCYDVGPLGTGNGEARRVVSAAAHFLAVMAVAYYVLHLQNLGRGFLAAIVPLATAFTLLGRALARYQLRVQRLHGHAARRALITGLPRNTGLLLDHLAANPQTGIVPVHIAVPGGEAELARPESWPQVPVTDELTGSTDVLRALAASRADLLIITGGMTGSALRKLTWRLEGADVAVMVAPTVAGLAGPQLDVRPLAGLPLLYVDHASLGLAPVGPVAPVAPVADSAAPPAPAMARATPGADGAAATTVGPAGSAGSAGPVGPVRAAGPTHGNGHAGRNGSRPAS